MSNKIRKWQLHEEVFESEDVEPNALSVTYNRTIMGDQEQQLHNLGLTLQMNEYYVEAKQDHIKVLESGVYRVNTGIRHASGKGTLKLYHGTSVMNLEHKMPFDPSVAYCSTEHYFNADVNDTFYLRVKGGTSSNNVYTGYLIVEKVG